MRVFGPLVVLLVSVTAQAQSIVEAPPLGHFQMRPDLEGQHPRLHFTADQIPAIRQHGLTDRNWYLEQARDAYGHYTGRPVDIDAGWKNYLFGFWGQFSMNMFYVVEDDTAAADTAIDWALHYARDDTWLADDLVPMDITSGMALTYDILYDRLTEAERDELRTALFRAADFIYDEFFIGEYWTSDFQNNHMHNRIHGLAHAAFAIYGDDPAYDTQKHADLALACFEQLVAWLPEDGSTHEGSGYYDYGHHWLVRLEALMEHVTGIDHAAANPHFAQDIYYRIYLTTPGWLDTFNIGDAGGGAPGNLTPMAHTVSKHSDAHGAAVLRRLMEVVPGGFYQHPAWGLLWYDGEMVDEPVSDLPLGHLWPDVDMLSVRSAWDDDATGLVFICGPPGGHKMNQLRVDDAWVNVAHDHPDQNHFLLYTHGKMMAVDDGYPKDEKNTRSHNTILVDGNGGPREGTGWYQAFPYAQTAFIQDAMLSDSSAVAAGDASRLYADADRFVRHIAFVEGDYLIIVDDLVGTGGGDHVFEWRLHKDGDWSTGAPGQYYVADGDVRLDIRFLWPEPGALTHQFLPAELTTVAPSLAVSTTAPRTRFVSVVVPQLDASPEVTAQRLAATGGEAVEIQQGAVVDQFGARLEGADLQFLDVQADGDVLIRRQDAAVLLAMLVGGSSLQIGGHGWLGSTPAADLAWRPTATGAIVEAKAPHRTPVGTADVTIGGLTPSAGYSVILDGTPGPDALADGQGIVALSLDLTGKRTVELVEGASIDGGVDAGPDDGSDDDGSDDGGSDPGPDGGDQVDAGQDGGAIANDTDAQKLNPISGSCGCSGSPAGGMAMLWIGLLAAIALCRRTT